MKLFLYFFISFFQFNFLIEQDILNLLILHFSFKLIYIYFILSFLTCLYNFFFNFILINLSYQIIWCLWFCLIFVIFNSFLYINYFYLKSTLDEHFLVQSWYSLLRNKSSLIIKKSGFSILTTLDFKELKNSQKKTNSLAISVFDKHVKKKNFKIFLVQKVERFKKKYPDKFDIERRFMLNDVVEVQQSKMDYFYKNNLEEYQRRLFYMRHGIYIYNLVKQQNNIELKNAYLQKEKKLKERYGDLIYSELIKNEDHKQAIISNVKMSSDVNFNNVTTVKRDT